MENTQALRLYVRNRSPTPCGVHTDSAHKNDYQHATAPVLIVQSGPPIYFICSYSHIYVRMRIIPQQCGLQQSPGSYSSFVLVLHVSAVLCFNMSNTYHWRQEFAVLRRFHNGFQNRGVFWFGTNTHRHTSATQHHGNRTTTSSGTIGTTRARPSVTPPRPSR